MIKGRVAGKVWSSRRIDTVPTGALLEVDIGRDSRLVAFDPLGCATGELVLIAQGSVAAGYFDGRTVPVDALIIASIDEQSSKDA